VCILGYETHCRQKCCKPIHLTQIEISDGELIVAADFFTVEVWTGEARANYCALPDRLVYAEGGDRGHRAAANGLWMSQIAPNLTDAEQGILTGKRYLIHDRDPLGSRLQSDSEQKSS